MSILHDNLGEILRVIESLDYPWSFALADHLETSIEARKGRSAGAKEVSRRRSELIRQRIQDAASLILAERPEIGRATLLRLVRARTGSSRATVNDELSTFGTEITFQRHGSLVSSST
jgi:hypothetical protein